MDRIKSLKTYFEESVASVKSVIDIYKSEKESNKMSGDACTSRDNSNESQNTKKISRTRKFISTNGFNLRLKIFNNTERKKNTHYKKAAKDNHTKSLNNINQLQQYVKNHTYALHKNSKGLHISQKLCEYDTNQILSDYEIDATASTQVYEFQDPLFLFTCVNMLFIAIGEYTR
jgi:hypothetical protein